VALLSPPKTRNREPLKPVDDFDRCAIRIYCTSSVTNYCEIAREFKR
jgi:hypothetical protein